ncbi:MFS transporter [Shewanella dokdonensis]|uniref:MFS transporter n=2 Tax=Shewanella dokdonensis TaxID=712036 RepID=A0ABX8DJC6_9GAMM|nr:MFS transporter [Shewanella dokdonensis]MCL1074412.1 MFS transporter [Shewanella dokdonensis]QVK24081.1 MFS transporter [Shewanella dokdonensis]
MYSDITFARFRQFPPLMWVLLLGSFFTRGSYFMVWPFLAVILYEKFALTATQVGLVLSNAAIIAVFTSFIGSSLSDHFGRRRLMYFTGVLYVISFSLLAQVNSVSGYVVVMTLCAIATSLWRPLTAATIGDIIAEPQTRELAMQSLYFMVNAGCAVGPMAGVWMGLTGKQSSFYITAVAFALLILMLHWGFKRQQQRPIVQLDNAQPTAKYGMGMTLKVLLADRLLQCLILANILCMFIYAQTDSSLVQYLTRAEAPGLLSLISSIIFTNACVIISSQFLLLKLLASYPLTRRIQIGLLLLLVSQLWLALNPIELFWGWIGAIVVLSLGETILFPTMNVHIDRLAPDHLRGAYFGAASAYDFGFALAPLGGGIILDHWGGPALFVTAASLTVLVIYLYRILDRLPRPDFTSLSKPQSDSPRVD